MILIWRFMEYSTILVACGLLPVIWFALDPFRNLPMRMVLPLFWAGLIGGAIMLVMVKIIQ